MSQLQKGWVTDKDKWEKCLRTVSSMNWHSFSVKKTLFFGVVQISEIIVDDQAPVLKDSCVPKLMLRHFFYFNHSYLVFSQLEHFEVIVIYVENYHHFVKMREAVENYKQLEKVLECND